MSNIGAHKLFGQGVWLMQARSAAQLRSMDGSRSVYIPMSSLGMFFNDSVIVNEKIDPTREMLLAATYIVSGDNTLSYIWTKASIPVETGKRPSVTIPSITERTGKKSVSPVKAVRSRGKGSIVTGNPVIPTMKKSPI